MAKTKTKILIDTHVFLWIFIEPKRFTKAAKIFVKDTKSNEFYLSHASAWEATIKFGIGKLKLPKPPEQFIPDRVRQAGYFHLPIELEHVVNVHSLPQIHRDPFDRLLISQANAEGLALLTADPIFSKYSVKTMDFAAIS
jgi:PIN domain nuclease of toxin-antitoxin system